jgi:integrase
VVGGRRCGARRLRTAKVMWRSGLRIAEALALEVKDLNFDVHAGA